MSTLVRQRALQTWVLSICNKAVLLSLIFLHWNSAFFLHSLLKFYSKQKFVWFCYLVEFISTLLFCKRLPVLPGFVVKNNAVQYRSLRWAKSHEIVIKMLQVEKVGAHAAFWENLCAKAGPNRASIDTSEKRIMLDYQLTVLLPARRYASAGYRDRNVSVCLSVRLSRAGIVSKRRKLAAWFLHHLVAPRL